MAATNKRAQDFVPIKEVRDGVVILKDGSMRSILMTSSVNFALKSEDEQKSIIYQFQNFLNSINFDIQIFLESRRLDIRPYVSLLEERQKEQTNDLMKIQTREYIQFIKTFTEQANIMTKRFFVVIPYTPPTLELGKRKKGGILSLGKGSVKDKKNQKISNFAEYKQQLDQRVDVVVQGITRTGVRAVQLGTEEVIEVFYQLFNPGEVEKPLVQNT
jgi:type IV secretory pathway VirB4 component